MAAYLHKFPCLAVNDRKTSDANAMRRGRLTIEYGKKISPSSFLASKICLCPFKEKSIKANPLSENKLGIYVIIKLTMEIKLGITVSM